MIVAAWILAEMLGMGAPATAPAAERYSLSEFCAAIERDNFRYGLADFSRWVERDAFRYRLADFSTWRERDASRYHLAEFADAVDQESGRCICMTTRMSPATLKAEVLLVSDCDCGN